MTPMGDPTFTHRVYPYRKPNRPSVCPGCGRCNECGNGPYYPRPYPYPTFPHIPTHVPTGPVWASNINTNCLT